MSETKSRQLDRAQQREVLARIEEIPWGDMEGHIYAVEEALEKAVAATAPEFPLWEAEGEERYRDEFSVSEDEIAVMSDEWRLAYVSRLVRSLASCYGVGTGDFGNEPPFLLADPHSPGGLLRALNDLIVLPVMAGSDRDQSAAEVRGERPELAEGESWLELDEDVEVIWTDGDGKAHKTVGSYQGIVVPNQGGPSWFVVKSGDEETSLRLQDMAGMTRLAEIPRE
jgi:hypothetical protein